MKFSFHNFEQHFYTCFNKNVTKIHFVGNNLMQVFYHIIDNILYNYACEINQVNIR